MAHYFFTDEATGLYLSSTLAPARTCQTSEACRGRLPGGPAAFGEAPASAAKRAWAHLIKQVYEVDPLVCVLRWTDAHHRANQKT